MKMEDVVGLVKVRVRRGTNLAARDFWRSDPYVRVTLAHQKVKTRVIKRNLTPFWDEELTLYITDHNMSWSLKLEVFDHDTFSRDDKMGDAVIDLQPLSLSAKKLYLAKSIPADNQLYCRIMPSKNNHLIKDSCIRYVNGNMVQDIHLRLQNVECGELELQPKWIACING